VVSYFIIVGALTSLYLFAGVLFEPSDSVVFATYGLAGMLGGFLAGRASRARTILEPALAALLVALSLFGFVQFIDLAELAPDLTSPDVSLSQAAIAFAAAIAGSKLGEDWQPVKVSKGKWWWGGLSALITVGSCFVAIVLAASLTEIFDSKIVGGFAAILVLIAPVVGGAVTQIAAPFPIGAKLPYMAVFFSVGMSALLMMQDPSGKVIVAFLGILLATLLLSLFATLGAKMVCKWAPSWLETEHLPTARAVVIDD